MFEDWRYTVIAYINSKLITNADVHTMSIYILSVSMILSLVTSQIDDSLVVAIIRTTTMEGHY